MKILLTGAAGFVGSNIAMFLLQKTNHSVFLCDDLSFGFRENVKGHSLYEEGFESMEEEELDFFDVLIHAATSNIIYAQEAPVNTFRNNALNTIDLFSKFKGKIIYLSTASVYGNAVSFPTKEDAVCSVSNAYDQSKLIAERFLRMRGNFTTLRLSNVYGPNQRSESPYCGFLGKAVRHAICNVPIPIHGDGKHTRDYTYVEDVVRAVVSAIEIPSRNTEINIATGQEINALQIVNYLESITGMEYVREFLPERKIDIIERRCLDNTRAKNLLSWVPEVLLPEGLCRTLEWMKEDK